MNKKVRRFSVIVAFFIAFIFQISVSLEFNNRGIRLKEQQLQSVATALNKVDSTSKRALLLQVQPRMDEDQMVYLGGDGEILYTNTFPNRAEAIVDFAKASSAEVNPSGEWKLFDKGLLENSYIHRVAYDDDTMLIGLMTYDTMFASTLHFLPYTVLAGLIGSIALSLWLGYKIERHQRESMFLLRSFNKYVRDPKYKLELSPLVDEYEEVVLDESRRTRKFIDELNSQLTGLNDMVKNMMEGVILVGEDRKILSINESAVKLVNASIHLNYVNKDLMYLCRERNFYNAFTHAFQSRRDEIRKIEIEGLIVKFFFDPVFNQAGKFYGMLILMIDETQQTLAERSRREFTSNVTHELKTPLTSISGYAELLRSGMAKKEDEEKFLNIIIEESKNLFDLIDAIISMSRLEEKNRPEEYRPVDMEVLVKDVLTSLQPDFESRNLRVSFETDRDNKLFTHPDLMRELIKNLVDNAIVYNVENGAIEITLDNSGNKEFVVKIQDTGIGISYDDQRRIFERFYMADKSRSYNQKSTGLGLAIVKHNVDSLKGTIDVKSQLHHGTLFTLRFPKRTGVPAPLNRA